PLQFYRWPVFFHSELQRGLRFVSDSTGTTKFDAPYGEPGGAALGQSGMIDQREQDPLDPNQHLMAPAWWSSTYSDPSGAAPLFPASYFGAGAANMSAAVTFFENYFYRLHESLSYGSATATGLFWDRGASYGGDFAARRAYF